MKINFESARKIMFVSFEKGVNHSNKNTNYNNLKYILQAQWNWTWSNKFAFSWTGVFKTLLSSKVISFVSFYVKPFIFALFFIKFLLNSNLFFLYVKSWKIFLKLNYLFSKEKKRSRCSLPAGLSPPAFPNPPRPLRADKLDKGIEPSLPA